MSTVDVRPVHSLSDRASYLECGVGQKKLDHAAAGTDRLASMYCSLGSIAEFVAHGERLAKKHGRRVQAQAYLQSFEQHEFDVRNQDDLGYVNDLGWELARRMHLTADVLVVTHDDSEGGHAHNHILVINHDRQTGRALTKYRTFGSVKKVNDALMREVGLRTVEDRRREIALGLEPGQALPQEPDLSLSEQLTRSLRRTQADYWQTKRGQLLGGEKHFDVFIGDAVAATMLDPDVADDDDLIAALAKIKVPGAPDDRRDGIKMVIDPEHGGTTFRAWNQKTGRLNRRSASKLSPSFKTENRQQFFEEKSAALEQQRQAEVDRLAVEEQARQAAYLRHLEMLDAQRRQWREGRRRFAELDEEAQRQEASDVLARELSRDETDRLGDDEFVAAIDAVQARLLAAESTEAPASAPAPAEPTVTCAPAPVPDALARYLEFEQSAVEALARGERLDEQEVKTLGVGPKFLKKFGDRMNPQVREQLELRVVKMAAAREEFEQRGRPLAERLQELKRRGREVTPDSGRYVGYRPTEIDRVDRDLQRSNRKVKRLRRELDAGIYEETALTTEGSASPTAERQTAVEIEMG